MLKKTVEMKKKPVKKLFSLDLFENGFMHIYYFLIFSYKLMRLSSSNPTGRRFVKLKMFSTRFWGNQHHLKQMGKLIMQSHQKCSCKTTHVIGKCQMNLTGRANHVIIKLLVDFSIQNVSKLEKKNGHCFQIWIHFYSCHP